MAITTRQGLIDYSLRRLGFPVIEINVDEDQISDRVDDALQMWQEYHFDGVERAYLKKKLSGSTLTIPATTFTVGETIEGGTSGAKAKVHKDTTTTALVYENTTTAEKFEAGETITGADSGASTTITSIAKGDIENGYIVVDDSWLGITRLFKFGLIAGARSDGLFDVDYQFALNDLYNLLSADVTYYSMVKTHLNLLENLFVNERAIRFNRKTNKLHIDTDMDSTFNIGDYVVAEGNKLIDPTEYSEVYDDMWLKRYTTSLIKRQWGENMKKFGGVALPGGVTLNGDQIYGEAVQEIATIEQEMQLNYELPPSFMVG